MLISGQKNSPKTDGRTEKLIWFNDLKMKYDL